MTTTTLTHPVVQFDAELLVHQASHALGCGSGVVIDEPVGWNTDPRHGTRRTVRRCVRERGHDGRHAFDGDGHGGGFAAAATVCGLSVGSGTWIDWTPSSDDPQCPTCHGEAEDTQDALL